MPRNRIQPEQVPEMAASSSVRSVIELAHFPTYSLPEDMPFKNDTTKWSGYEITKAIVMLPVALVRVVITLIALLVCWAFAKLVTVGLSLPDLNKPLPRWRRFFRWCMRPWIRLFAFGFGVMWVSHRGRRLPKAEAPIVVANHICWLEPAVLLSILLSTSVSRIENYHMPVVGTILAALQCIFVERTQSQSRTFVRDQITRRAKDERFTQVLVFAEGTVNNQTSILEFKRGAFYPGMPVQPVAVRIPFQHFNPAWVSGASLLQLVLHSLIQFHQKMELVWLPAHVPSEAEKADPQLFAESVRRTIAKELQLPLSGFSYEDVGLQMAATKVRLPPDYAQVGFEKLSKLARVRTSVLRTLFNVFREADVGRKGYLSVDEFVALATGAAGETVDAKVEEDAAASTASAAFKPSEQDGARLFEVFNCPADGKLAFHHFVVGVAALNNLIISKDNTKAEEQEQHEQQPAVSTRPGVEAVLVAAGFSVDSVDIPVSLANRLLLAMWRGEGPVPTAAADTTSAITYTSDGVAASTVLAAAANAEDFYPAQVFGPALRVA